VQCCIMTLYGSEIGRCPFEYGHRSRTTFSCYREWKGGANDDGATSAQPRLLPSTSAPPRRTNLTGLSFGFQCRVPHASRRSRMGTPLQGPRDDAVKKFRCVSKRCTTLRALLGRTKSSTDKRQPKLARPFQRCFNSLQQCGTNREMA